MKSRKILSAIAFGGIGLATQVSAAADWTMHLTCDNQFSLYFGTPVATDFVAGSGNNWPTTYTFNATGRAISDYIYVATASDQSVAQGLIGDFNNTTNGMTALTGDANWEVFPAGRYLNQLGFGPGPWPASVMPTQAQVDTAIAYAQTNGLWLPTDTAPGGALNGVGPWGFRSGISAAAEWIWHRAPGGPADPLHGGFNHEEFLVFRLGGNVPAPSALAILGVSGLVGTRRRR